MVKPALPSGWVATLLWAIWLVLLGVWTVGLLIPDPHHKLGVTHVDHDLRFFLSKSTHLVAYAFLAGFAAWLPVGPRGRVMLIAFLLFHGAATEFLQQFVPSRTASLLDVAIDAVGTFLGTFVAWAWRTRFSRQPAQ